MSKFLQSRQFRWWAAIGTVIVAAALLVVITIESVNFFGWFYGHNDVENRVPGFAVESIARLIITVTSLYVAGLIIVSTPMVVRGLLNPSPSSLAKGSGRGVTESAIVRTEGTKERNERRVRAQWTSPPSPRRARVVRQLRANRLRSNEVVL